METQIKIEKLRLDCGNSDLQISACRNNLKKCELLLVCDDILLIKFRVPLYITLGRNWTQ